MTENTNQRAKPLHDVAERVDLPPWKVRRIVIYAQHSDGFGDDWIPLAD